MWAFPAVFAAASCGREAPYFAPRPGALAVHSTPTGASILLDGVPTGLLTPDTLEVLSAGEYVVRVGLLGYTPEPESLVVNVIADQIAVAEFGLLEPPTGAIAVVSNPPGAAIALDGADTGTVTPDTLRGLAPARYTLRVSLTGYSSEPESLAVEVVAGETARAQFALSAPSTGAIAVTSAPETAAIRLDGLATGLVTPDTLRGLAPGEHVVRASLPGYTSSPESLSVVVVAGGVAAAHFALTPPTTGAIAVTSTPAGARVFLDRAETGASTPATLQDVPPGDHIVAVRLDGYVASPDSLIVSVVAGETAQAGFTLSEPPPAAKVALLESFSNVSCVGCPAMAATLSGLMGRRGYGPDRVLLIKYSMSWPQATDPMYRANQADNDARMNYYMPYMSTGIPTLAGDGALLGGSGSPPAFEDLVTRVDALLAAEPGFGIGVQAPVAGGSVPVTVTLSANRAVDLAGCVLHVALVENPVVFASPPGSQGETEFHWVMRDFGTAEGVLPALAAGQPVVRNVTLARNPAWIPENLIVIAFVQKIATRAILQAGSTAVPAGAGEHDVHPAPNGWSARAVPPKPAGGTHR